VERAFASPPAAVACGNEHTAVLLRNGDLLTAGYNDNGQCGQGHIKRVPELTKVAGVKAGGVFACNGCEHTCVVDRGGGLLTFGYNYRGQLGHGTAGSELVPRPVRGLEGKRVRTVSCSYYHTAVLTHDDLVYSFGRNDFGQLGHGDLADKKFPHPVDQVKGRRLLDVGCGQYVPPFLRPAAR
jgi:RCC1 and BTB domain-containing protein